MAEKPEGEKQQSPSLDDVGRRQSNALITDEDTPVDSTSNPQQSAEGSDTQVTAKPKQANKPYVNIGPGGQIDTSTQPSNSVPAPRAYENIDIKGNSPTKSPTHSSSSTPNSAKTSPVHLAGQASDLSVQRSPQSDNSPSPQLLESRLKLLACDTEGGCHKCKELQSVVALWELGVSGLTRNYSKILSKLNKARDAAWKLEAQVIKERNERNDSEVNGSMLGRNMTVSGRKAVTVRQSMFEPGMGGPPTASSKITDQLYPQEADRAAGLSVGHMKQFKELTTQLAQAIDLCQQLAAANFKSNQRSLSKRPKLQRQPTVPSKIDENTVPSDFRPALQSIAETSLSSSFKRKTLERTPSAPESTLRRNEDQKCRVPDEQPTQNGAKVNSQTTDPSTAADAQSSSDGATAVSNGVASPTLANQKPLYSHMMKLSSQDEMDSEKSTELSGESSLKSDEFRDPVLSTASTFSDNDVKQIMSKIADLEEERVKLLGTIDDLHRDNNVVRLSLNEILGDLENKDLQLTLAMQDLTIATGEIKRAAEMRKKLQDMETERNALNERLSNLEDESAAVKVSLIQLLQEKSATNKTLALENWRLNQRIKSGATLRRTSVGGGDGDNVSVTSGFSSLTDDATLQEAYMGADDVASFVHKQGFLVKQGGRRKNWKRRLFVLSPEGLSYYKTEQPLQILPIDKINKVQICHGRTVPHPHMFEVHTPGRVFMLSAPTEDEMQSWVGMLQTLKQYNKGTTLNREATNRRTKAALGATGPGDSPVHIPPQTNGQTNGHSEPLASASPEHLPLEQEPIVPLPVAMSSDDDDDHLMITQDHFGSDDDFEGTPQSVPSMMSPTVMGIGAVALPNVKPLARLRSDST